MNDQQDDGGPAFPRPNAIGPSAPGMSLRDWFAGQALTGILAQGSTLASYAVGDAYRMADAMLEERKR